MQVVRTKIGSFHTASSQTGECNKHQRDKSGTGPPCVLDTHLALPGHSSTAARPVRDTNSSAIHRLVLWPNIAHQFITSLVHPGHRPEDGWADFEIWYHSEQAHPAAAEIYITLVLEYLSAAEGEDEEGEYGGVLFDFRAPLVGDLCRPLGRVSITYVEQYTALHPGAMVVSANQVISFGRSATQEELYFGCAHETCPAVLFVPRLGDSALIISPVTSNLRIEGARRSTSWFRARSSGHTFLLMDALEMDEVEGGVRANLDPANMDREIAKAYTTFSGAADLSVHRVATPAWGCGAFCGVPGVKVPLLRSAAASAGVDLEVVVDPPHHLVAREFEAFTRRWSGSARELRERLGGVPADLVGVDVLAAL